MVSSEYVSRLAAAINDLEWARHEIDYRRLSFKGHAEHEQDINHIINQLTVLIEDHCKQNVGED